MRKRGALLAALALLLALPVAGAAGIAFDLPEALQVSRSTLIAGNIAIDGPAWNDPAAVGARTATMPPNNLTVCPIRVPAGGTLVQAIAALRDDCTGGETFQAQSLAFGAGTDLRFAGAYDPGMPQAAVLALFADPNATAALLPSDDGVTLTAAANGLRFAGAAARSAVGVQQASGTRWFNGTGYAFLSDAPHMALSLRGLAAEAPGPMTVTVTAAPRDRLGQALRPFDLLDLQEAMLGADRREPRSNVSALLGEHGRVGQLTNGAVFGHVSGTVDGQRVEGTALVRGAPFTLAREGKGLVGEFDPSVAILPEGVAVEGGEPRSAPWGWAVVLAVVTLCVVAVRRAAPSRTWPMRASWAGAAVLAFLVADALVLRGTFGAGAWSEWSEGGRAGTVLAIAAFDGVLVLASYVLFALPGRVLLGRLVPRRWLPAAEGAWAFVWLLLPWLFPARFFALAHAFARL